MKARAGDHSKGKSVLLNVAESIGTTLGTIAAKANAMRTPGRNPRSGSVRLSANGIVPKKKKREDHTKDSAQEIPKPIKVTKSPRRGLHKTPSRGQKARAVSAKSSHR
jgi:hypothetical protein